MKFGIGITLGLLLAAAIVAVVACASAVEVPSAEADAGTGAGGSGGDADDWFDSGIDGGGGVKIPVDADAWCAPDAAHMLEKTACCDGVPCYGQCYATASGLVCECAGIPGGCPEGLVCCIYGSEGCKESSMCGP